MLEVVGCCMVVAVVVRRRGRVAHARGGCGGCGGCGCGAALVGVVLRLGRAGLHSSSSSRIPTQSQVVVEVVALVLLAICSGLLLAAVAVVLAAAILAVLLSAAVVGGPCHAPVVVLHVVWRRLHLAGPLGRGSLAGL